MDHGNGSKGSDIGDGGRSGVGGRNGDGGSHRVDVGRPGDELQVSTDGWRPVALWCDLVREPPAVEGIEGMQDIGGMQDIRGMQDRRDVHAGRGASSRLLRPDAVLSTPRPPREAPLLVLLVAGSKEFACNVAPGRIDTVTPGMERIYLRADFAAVIDTVTALEIGSEPFDDFGRMPSAPRELIEAARAHYTCPQSCTWSETSAGGAGPGVYTFHDGAVGVQLRVEGGDLVGMHWLNRRGEHLLAASLKGRRLERRPLDVKGWHIGGHPVNRQPHAT